MFNTTRPSTRFPIFRRLWKPAVVTGAGGAAIAIWLDEIVMFGEDLLALVFLPIMAGIVYLLDIFIFKSRMPKREDLQNITNQDTRKSPYAINTILAHFYD